MAILTIEDLTGKLDVVVFPKAFRSHSKDIYQDNIVVIEGSFSVDERESKVIAFKLNKLSKVNSDVHLKIAPHYENALVQRELKRIFDKYKGNDEVYLHLEGSKKIVKTNSSFWVDSSIPEFKNEIKKVLGEDCFI
jgi:DNA polymerase-3 subunit alpha